MPASGGRSRQRRNSRLRSDWWPLSVAPGGRVRLFSTPPALFRGVGLGPVLQRLTLPLLVDDAETHHILDWAPAVAPAIGLATTARQRAPVLSRTSPGPRCWHSIAAGEADDRSHRRHRADTLYP
jgi:hypothetical protein